MRALKGFGMVVLASLCSLASAQEGKVRIIAPEPGAVVRGVVQIVADKPDPTEGTYAWKVGHIGQEAEAQFQANTVAGLPFLWDTSVRNEKGERVYPDGEYLVIANGLNDSGELEGSATVLVRIANEIPPADVADGVKLQINLKTADVLNYVFNGDEKISLDMTTQQTPDAQPNVIQTTLEGAYTLKMLSGAGDGMGGFCRQTCTDGVLYPQNASPFYINDVDKAFMQDYVGDGVIGPYKAQDPHFALGESYLQLPSRVLTLGSPPWKSDLALVLELFSQYRLVVTAENRLDGFEWVRGERCARIKSDFNEPNLEFEAPISGQLYKIKGISGTRITYFAYERGYPVSMEDTLHYRGELDQMAGGTTSGGGVTPGGGMMPGRGMMPGGGGAAMGGGMGPGMGMGMGMGMGAQAGGMMPGGGTMPGGGMMPGGGAAMGMGMGRGMGMGAQAGGMMPGGGTMPGGGMMPGGGTMPGGGGAPTPQKIKADFDVTLTVSVAK